MAHQEANGRYISGITLTAERLEGYSFLRNVNPCEAKQGPSSRPIDANDTALRARFPAVSPGHD